MGGDLHTYLANLGHVPSTDLGSSSRRASAAAIKTAQLDYGLGSLPGKGAGGSLAWARSEVLVTVRFGPAAQSEFDFWYNKGIEVSVWHVPRGRPQDATRRASSELAWIQGARVLLAAHEEVQILGLTAGMQHLLRSARSQPDALAALHAAQKHPRAMRALADVAENGLGAASNYSEDEQVAPLLRRLAELQLLEHLPAPIAGVSAEGLPAPPADPPVDPPVDVPQPVGA